MAEVDVEALKRKEPTDARVTDAIGRAIDTRYYWCSDSEWDAIIAALERAKRLWVCGRGHVVEIEAGTPPYDMPSCPICTALERAERVEALLREQLDGERLACARWTDDGADCGFCWGCRIRAALESTP
jgi:hypothetical protein